MQHANTIGIIGKINAISSAWDVIGSVVAFCQARGKKVLLDNETLAPYITGSTLPLLSREDLAQQSDVIIIIGGDGSLLHAARTLVDHEKPLIGINMGRLGFLTDIPAHGMTQTLAYMFNGQYQHDRRLMLKVQVRHQAQLLHEAVVLNDIVITKQSPGKMIEFETLIDQRFLKSERSDGMIIATPTGSTAYSMSAGGSILDPGLHCVNLVSINPHTLSARPLVVSADSTIEIRNNDLTGDQAAIVCDGQECCILNKNDTLHVQKYHKPLHLYHPKHHDHFHLLRTKLHWGDKL